VHLSFVGRFDFGRFDFGRFDFGTFISADLISAHLLLPPVYSTIIAASVFHVFVFSLSLRL
jgi:hypothetical protein